MHYAIKRQTNKAIDIVSYNEEICITLVTALGSSYSPASIATWPGRDSVGTRVWDMPSTPGKYLYQQ